ncbi:MAG: hypothetical protein K0R57_1127 [Paenibacillaceae bacterium]|jgi:hypothetical protein|nr:hypothetical protein [Paenibacillaceae bacterium]
MNQRIRLGLFLLAWLVIGGVGCDKQAVSQQSPEALAGTVASKPPEASGKAAPTGPSEASGAASTGPSEPPGAATVSSGAALSSQSPEAASGLSPQAFIEAAGLAVEGSPGKFAVKIPGTWQVKLGEYPVGLYWETANEFSKDAGLDLTLLKGSEAEAWRYSLQGGLKDPQGQNEFDYPSNLLLLVQSGRTVGAWLEFNVQSIGPSVKKRTLEQITGLSLADWIEQKGVFSDDTANEDLVELEPTGVLDAFFQAVDTGNKTRARACLSPASLLQSLTVNREANVLYNPGFGEMNASSEGILEAKPISYKLMDLSSGSEIKEVGDRTTVEVEVNLHMKLSNPAFNSPDGKETRFAILNKYQHGWKLDGLGTGP